MLMVFALPKILPPDKSIKVKWIRTPFALWNLVLSVFSIWGLINTAQSFPGFFMEDGYLCTDPFQRIKAMALGFAPGTGLLLFIFSKLFELFDTLFLILKRRNVRLLQWYHHVTVMLFCWLALATEYAPGMWFAVMNYTVHSVMYMYFAVAEQFPSLRPRLRKISPFITLMQTSQMVFGLIVNACAVYLHVTRPGECHIVQYTIYASIVMYFSYFILFAKLFYDSVIKSKKALEENCCKNNRKEKNA